MSEFITPEHKIIALILEASGEPTDADKVCCLGNIPDVALAVRQLRETVIQHCASEAIPAENTQTVSECLTQPFSDKILPPQNSGESEADRPQRSRRLTGQPGQNRLSGRNHRILARLFPAR